MQIQGKTALVTGAGRGIGRAVCRELMRRGAAGVVVADLDGDLAQATAAELGGLGLRCDVADAESVTAAVAATERHFGRLDNLFSNAGNGSTAISAGGAGTTGLGADARQWYIGMAHSF